MSIVDFSPLKGNPQDFIEWVEFHVRHWFSDQPMSDDEASVLCDLAETVDRLIREHDRQADEDARDGAA